jgi:predicted ATPase
MRGEFLVARELGEQLLGLAQREQDPALLMEAYWAVGSTLFHLGEFGAAQAHLEQGLTLYDAQRHSHVSRDGLELGVIGLGYAARVLWHLGYPDQALQKSKAARTLGQELSHPFIVAAARIFAAMVHQFRRERALTQEWAAAGITLAREQGFPNWLWQGTVLQGWALAERGQVEEGIPQLRQGLATWQAAGAGLNQSYYLALLAEAYGKAGQAEDGLAALAEALTVMDKTEERFYEAELYRLKGELTLQKEARGWRLETGPTSPQASSLKPQVSGEVAREAKGYFHKAIEIAQRQQAKSLELRAATSLARLWQQQGKREEACKILAEIYGWFTEGFDTVDLKEAKAFLARLS